jgi:hypothetical protein
MKSVRWLKLMPGEIYVVSESAFLDTIAYAARGSDNLE